MALLEVCISIHPGFSSFVLHSLPSFLSFWAIFQFTLFWSFGFGSELVNVWLNLVFRFDFKSLFCRLFLLFFLLIFLSICGLERQLATFKWLWHLFAIVCCSPCSCNLLSSDLPKPFTNASVIFHFFYRILFFMAWTLIFICLIANSFSDGWTALSIKQSSAIQSSLLRCGWWRWLEWHAIHSNRSFFVDFFLCDSNTRLFILSTFKTPLSDHITHSNWFSPFFLWLFLPFMPIVV